MNNCKVCSKPTKNKIYCGNICRGYPASIHSAKGRELKAEKAREQNALYSKERREEVNENIRQALFKKYGVEVVENLKFLLNNTLMCSDRLVAKAIGKSTRVLYRIITENGLEDAFYKRHKFIPKKVQMFSPTELDIFKKDMWNLPWDEIMEKYKIGKKSLLRLYKILDIKKVYKKVNKSETKPERLVREILENLCIPFRQEVYIGGKLYRADFLLEGNKVIEVQGDYYHVNPKIYDYDFLNDYQKEKVKYDAKKNLYYKSNGYKVLEIWESETKEDLKIVESKIVEYERSN